MKKPKNIEIFEHPLATYWLDKDGILNLVSKPEERTIENSKSLIQSLKKTLAGKKSYCITDLTLVKEIPEESRVYYKEEVPALFNAVAYVTDSELSRMVATVFSLIFNPSIPTKIFSNESEARTWLIDLQSSGRSIIPKSTNEKKIWGTIVLVDDAPFEGTLMKYALKESNWSASLKFFTEPYKAIEYLKETKDKIFLIISDINMPRIDGFEFKKTIDNDLDLAKKATPFIFISTSVEKADLIKGYDNGVHGYFQKPMDIKEASVLLDKIFNYWLVSHHPYKNDF